MRRFRFIAMLILAIAVHEPVKAEVMDSSEMGFLVKNEAMIAATPSRVYTALTGRIGSWWDPEHTFSGESRNLSIDPKPGGCFCERLPKKGGVRHATVIFVSPGEELRLSGALGPLQEGGIAGSMIWKLSELSNGTKVELSYSAGGYHSGGLLSLAPAVDLVLGSQLLRLKNYMEVGRPQPD